MSQTPCAGLPDPILQLEMGYDTIPKLHYSILDLIIQAGPLHPPLSCLFRVRILLVRQCRLV